MKHSTTTKWGWGLFKRSLSMCRSGKGMQWSDRPRPRIGWGVCIRLNSPPRINNQLSMIYLWSFIWKEGRTLISINNSRFGIHRKFYQEQSRNKLKRYIFSPI